MERVRPVFTVIIIIIIIIYLSVSFSIFCYYFRKLPNVEHSRQGHGTSSASYIEEVTWLDTFFFPHFFFLCVLDELSSLSQCVYPEWNRGRPSGHLKIFVSKFFYLKKNEMVEFF